MCREGRDVSIVRFELPLFNGVMTHLAIGRCHLWQNPHHRLDKMKKSHRNCCTLPSQSVAHSQRLKILSGDTAVTLQTTLSSILSFASLLRFRYFRQIIKTLHDAFGFPSLSLFVGLCVFRNGPHTTHTKCVAGGLLKISRKRIGGTYVPFCFGERFVFRFFLFCWIIEAASPFTVIHVRTFVLTTLPSHIPFLNF